MKIVSGRLGDIDIDPAKIIMFPEGVIGFPKYKRFLFLPFMEDSPFELLQAVDHGNLAFITIDPFMFVPNYQFELIDSDMEAVQALSMDDITVRVIVNIPEDPEKATANMQGPLLINESRLIGRQVVLHDKSLDAKQSVFSRL